MTANKIDVTTDGVCRRRRRGCYIASKCVDGTHWEATTTSCRPRMPVSCGWFDRWTRISTPLPLVVSSWLHDVLLVKSDHVMRTSHLIHSRHIRASLAYPPCVVLAMFSWKFCVTVIYGSPTNPHDVLLVKSLNLIATLSSSSVRSCFCRILHD